MRDEFQMTREADQFTRRDERGFAGSDDGCLEGDQVDIFIGEHLVEPIIECREVGPNVIAGKRQLMRTTPGGEIGSAAGKPYCAPEIE